MSRKLILGLLFALPVLSPALAQDDTEAIASGLNNLRHIEYGSDGTLYIAEAGTGGDETAAGPYGDVKIGLTGQITVVSPDGEQSVLVPELVSTDSGFGDIRGADAIHVTDDAYWLVLGMGPKDVPEGKHVEAVVGLSRDSMEVTQVIDLRAFEDANNPDTGQEIISNPSGLALADDGTMYIADASGNSLLKWTEAGGLQLFEAWPVDDSDQNPQAVPTAVDIGPDGNIYVGFLTGYPFPQNGARIEVWSPAGELVKTYEGLTLVTDVLVADDGTIYAVQFADGFGDQGYNPQSGSVVTVSDDGLTPVAEGLNFPYGLAQDADGHLVVTVNSAFSDPDSGMVVPIG